MRKLLNLIRIFLIECTFENGPNESVRIVLKLSNTRTRTRTLTPTSIINYFRNPLEPLRSAPVTNHERIFATCHDVSSRQPPDLNCVKSILDSRSHVHSSVILITVSLQCMCMDTVREITLGYTSTSSSLPPVYSDLTLFGSRGK